MVTANLLGRALERPEQGVRRLRTLGIEPSHEQHQQIQRHVQSGNIEAAQQIILSLIPKDLTAGSTQTLTGQIAVLNRSWQEVGTVLGEMATPAVREVTGWMQSLADTMKNLSPQQQEAIFSWITFGLELVGVTVAIRLATTAMVGMRAALAAIQANPLAAIATVVVGMVEGIRRIAERPLAGGATARTGQPEAA